MAFVKIAAKTVNGNILQSPQTFELNCSILTPIGNQVVRQYNGNECIVAVKVFLIQAGKQLLGSLQFKGMNDYLTYINANCTEIGDCYLAENGCFTTINGCLLKY